MLDLNKLQELDAFVKDELLKKTITFQLSSDSDEITTEIFVRRLSIGIHEAMWTEARGKDASMTAKLLSQSVRLGENGEQQLSYEEAYRLHPEIALAMAKAVNEVNGGDRKNSVPPTS